MEIATVPANEQERLKALNEYHIFDTAPGDAYGDITRLIADICDVPVVLIGLFDSNRLVFLAKYGFESVEIPADSAFSTYSANFPGETIIVSDTRADHRFKGDALVTEGPHVVFYAAMPLISPAGYPVGTLSVLDFKPRTLSPIQLKNLGILTKQVVTLLELRKTGLELNKNKKELERAYNDLDKFSVLASHDLKSPLNNIISISHLLKSEYAIALDTEGNEYINYMKDAAYKLSDLVSGMQSYSRTSRLSADAKDLIDMPMLIEEIKTQIDPPENCIVSLKNNCNEIITSGVALKQILLNLLANGIKHNDKPEIRVSVTVNEDADSYIFEVQDNGRGISQKDQSKIFDLFETLHHKKKGDVAGIGLSIVKRLVEKLGGEITVNSKVATGSSFIFTIPK